MSRCLCLGIIVLLQQTVVYGQTETESSSEKTGSEGRDLTLEAGHLQRFGTGRPSYPIEEVDGFPDGDTFFKDYVLTSRPLKMKGAARLSPAFKLWTDSYFLSLDIDPNSTVLIEEHKKENRTLPVTWMNFQEFVRVYNDSNKYMVQDVPPYLKEDVMVPCSIQCPDLLQGAFMNTIMWFSSGGTKSVIHTDSMDNINCLYRGDKELFFVDPKYKDKIPLKTHGSYSAIDVDRMDYTQYPGLAEIEYHLANMSAGDCLYIPYLWIHQVRSYGSNLAVNVWWNNSKSLELDTNECFKECDHNLNLANVNFDFKEETDPITELQDLMFEVAENKDIELDDLVEILLGEKLASDLKRIGAGYGYIAHSKTIFTTFDVNSDSKITVDELESLSDESWEVSLDLITDLEVLVDAIQKSSFATPREEL